MGARAGLLADRLLRHDRRRRRHRGPAARRVGEVLRQVRLAAPRGAVPVRRLDAAAVNTGYQFELGADFAGASRRCLLRQEVRRGLGRCPERGAGVRTCHRAPARVTRRPPAPSTAVPIASNSLSGTISDNEDLCDHGALQSRRTAEAVCRLRAHRLQQPEQPAITAGTVTIGGYVLAFTSTILPTTTTKTLQVFWAGLKCNDHAGLRAGAAYYGYNQNSFATGKDAGCTSKMSGGCSGTENAASIAARLSPSTSASMCTRAPSGPGVQDGLANGFHHHLPTITTTIGLRFKF